MKIASLVSGGVDSSVTIHLLKEQGYDPHIFYIKIGLQDDPAWVDCPAEEDIEIVTWLAKKYDCPLEVISLQEEYWDRVISYTIEAVKKGLTPNPDMMCNKMIKFGAFDEKYGSDFDLISTGHYASTLHIDGEKYLATARDHFKDQTYFLGQINRQQLSKLVFPLGDLVKGDVRRIADQARLPSAHRKDSQGICFLGKINYNDFIKRYVGTNPGNIVEAETGKVLGQHEGLWFHTIGQRRGLGMSGGPWFVVDKDIEQNRVLVSNGYDADGQYKTVVNLAHFEFINGHADRDYDTAQEVKFKIRHQPEFNEGTLQREGDRHIIQSQQRLQGVAPGQFGVIYTPDATICLGSGVIVV
ncbi:MAG: tRNA 2-thiouridine(34) synthase MnmA [Clostridia bacterium]|nr:tRNA 2-thiouridine(34) synthase MnmA [Clostridia bacterium]